MKVGKPKSKRTPTRLRHKIEKASAAKQRKARKEAKKNPQWRSRLKKDPGIPNLFPYKDRMLAEVEEGRRRKIEERDQRREETRKRRTGGAVEDDTAAPIEQLDQDGEMLDMAEYSDDEPEAAEDEDDDGDAAMSTDANPMAALLASARARAHDFDAEALDSASEGSDGDGSDAGVPVSEDAAAPHAQGHATTPQSQARALEELVATSDTLLYILDARDPGAGLSRSLTQRIASDPSKRLLLVLNKADLVPRATAQAWLQRLSTSTPTYPLIASKPQPPVGAGARPTETKPDRPSTDAWTATSTSGALLKALKASAATRALRTHTIGLLGHRGAGKSATATALSYAAGRPRAIATAGRDAGARRIRLDASTSLLDGPAGTTTTAAAAARGALAARLTLLGALDGDLEAAVDELVRRVAAANTANAATVDAAGAAERSADTAATALTTLCAAYNTPPAPDTPAFLVGVARARGRLGRGGVPNLRAAAQSVLSDWREGRVRCGWVDAPPSSEASSGASSRAAGPAGALAGGVGAVGGRADEKRVVAGFAEEFRIEGLWNDGGLRGEGGAEVEMGA